MCSGMHTAPQSRPAAASTFPAIGEKGMLLLEFTGESPEIYYGEVTNAKYDFIENPIRFVDVRDAAFFLGPEFSEVQ